MTQQFTGVVVHEALPPKLLLTVIEAAQALNLSRAFMYRLLQRGELASLKLGGSRRIAWIGLLAFVERHMAEQQLGGDNHDQATR